jgi:hypothetical protein
MCWEYNIDDKDYTIDHQVDQNGNSIVRFQIINQAEATTETQEYTFDQNARLINHERKLTTNTKAYKNNFIYSNGIITRMDSRISDDNGNRDIRSYVTHHENGNRRSYYYARTDGGQNSDTLNMQEVVRYYDDGWTKEHHFYNFENKKDLNSYYFQPEGRLEQFVRKRYQDEQAMDKLEPDLTGDYEQRIINFNTSNLRCTSGTEADVINSNTQNRISYDMSVYDNDSQMNKSRNRINTYELVMARSEPNCFDNADITGLYENCGDNKVFDYVNAGECLCNYPDRVSGAEVEAIAKIKMGQTMNCVKGEEPEPHLWLCRPVSSN